MKRQQQSALTQSPSSWFSLHCSWKKTQHSCLCCPNAAMAARIPFPALTYLIFLSISFTSPQNALLSTTELISPLLPLSSLCIILVIFPASFPLLAYKPASLLYLSQFSHISSSHSCPSSWSGRSLSLRALLPCLCLVRLPVKLLLYSTPCW